MSDRPESVDKWLAGFSGQTESADLSFTLNPKNIRETLSGLVAQYPFLWFTHLMQLCLELGEKSQVWLGEDDESWKFGLEPETRIPEAELAPEFVESANPLSDSVASKLSRILVELQAIDSRATYQFRHDFCYFVIPKFKTKIRPRHLISQSFACTTKFGVLNFEQFIPSVSALNPGLYAPMRNAEETFETNYWCDFESIQMPKKQETGFPWNVHAVAQRLGEIGPDIFFHPLERQRGFASQTVFGQYPPNVSHRMSVKAKDQFLTWRVKRVLGVFWGPLVRIPSQIRPVIKGVLAEPIFLRHFPDGFCCYCEASQLKTDLSGLRLVANEAQEQWRRKTEHWMVGAIREYLPLFPKVRPYLWSMVKNKADIQARLDARPPELRFGFYKVLHKLFGEDKIREKRVKEIKLFLEEFGSPPKASDETL